MSQDNSQQRLPLLPLRDVVVYPHMVVPLFVGRERSILALDEVMAQNKQVVLLAQRDSGCDDPQPDDLYQVGTLATVLQMLKLPDGTVKVLVEGAERVAVESITEESGYFVADFEAIEVSELDSTEAQGMVRVLNTRFEKYVSSSKKVPSEVVTTVAGIEEPGRQADTVASHMALTLEQKQEILEITDEKARVEKLLGFMEGELDVAEMEQKIRGRVKKQMEKSQREYYLNEQMKAIQKELGDMDDGQTATPP